MQLRHSRLRHDYLICRVNNEVVVWQFGFLLWQTREEVGTPRVKPEDLASAPLSTHRHAELVSFVNARSTPARTGLLVHFTAPTINANWIGTSTLEITNLGPFVFVLREGDALAQLTVAMLSSAPDLSLKKSRSKTVGQVDSTGSPPPGGS
jgi:dCTP deaminase